MNEKTNFGGKTAVAIAAGFALLISPAFAEQPAVTPNSTQNVNVVNTPTVNVGSLPSVTVGSMPSVTVGSLPPVTFSGTPTVNANVTFPGTQGVTVTSPGPLTNVGRLPSQQLTIAGYSGPVSPIPCATKLYNVGPDGIASCFDMTNHQGQVLVITDISWQSTGAAGATCAGGLRAAPGAIFPLVISTAVVNADNTAAKTEHFTTGVKLTVNPVVSSDGAVSPSCSTPSIMMMNAYLMTNQ